MSSELSSLLVRDQVVGVRLVEEALERQVLYGGDFSTNLLELRAVHEEVLVEYRARVEGLPPAGRRDLASAAPEALRLLSREHAEKWRIVPLRFDGERLIVAAAAPPPADALDELSFLLSAVVAPQIAMEHRIAWALERFYGLPIAPRFRRLLDRIAAEDDEARTLESGEPSGVLVTPAVTVAAATPEPEAPAEPAAEPEKPPEEPVATIESAEPPRDSPTERVFLAPVPQRAAARTEIVFPAAGDGEPVRARGPARTLGGFHAPVAPVRPAAERRPRPPSGELLEPAKPVDLPSVYADQLAAAATRDEVIDALVAAGRHLFEYVAVFVVHGDVADGKRASGRGATTAVVEQIHLALTVPSSFRTAAEARSVYLGPPSGSVDSEALVALGRRAPPSICLVPIALRGRTVLLLYADLGDRTVPSTAAAELASLAPRAAMALERVILARKIAARRSAAEAAGASAPAVERDTKVEPTIVPPPEPEQPPERDTKVEPTVVPPPEPEPPPERDTKAEPTFVPLPEPEPPRELDTAREPEPEPPPDQAYEEVAVRDIDDSDLWDGDEPVEPSESEDPDADEGDDLGAIGVGEDETTEEDRKSSAHRGDIDLLLRSYVEVDPIREPGRRVRGQRQIRSKYQTLPEVGRPAALQQPVSGISGRLGSEAPRPRVSTGPSVIVDMGGEIGDLVAGLFGTPEEADLSAAALQKAGEAALPAIVERFPGPLRYDRKTARGPLPRAVDCGPILRLLVAFRRTAIPYLRPLFGSPNAEARFYAVLLARELQEPDLLHQLSERTFDEDYGVRTLALDTLRFYRRFPEIQDSLRTFRAIGGDEHEPPERRARSIEVLGALHDVGALRLFVLLLDAKEPAMRDTAHRSLVLVTCQDFGLNARRWSTWLDRNVSRHRIEWLIDALVHASPEIRLTSSEELKRLTKQYFGYYYNLPKRDRERARKRYLAWWEQVGRARFARR